MTAYMFLYAQLPYEAYLLSPTVRICKQGQLIVKVIESIMSVIKVFMRGFFDVGEFVYMYVSVCVEMSMFI